MQKTLVNEQFGPVFDADNHYWESSDAFTRHRDPKYRDRGLVVREVDGVLRYLIDDKVVAVPPGPGDVHARPAPGSFLTLFSGQTKLNDFNDAFEVSPADHPEWYNRDRRLAVMDAQGLEAVWMFPSQAVTMEARLQNDIEAAIEIFQAFNRWVEEEWGFAHKGRIFSAPYMTLSDPHKAVAELEWALDKGARIVNLRHGPAFTADGPRSPAHPMFDPFWARVEEAGIVVSSHGCAENTYDPVFDLLRRNYGEQPDGTRTSDPVITENFPGTSIFEAMMKGRLVSDFAFILVAHRLFERFPRLKYAFVEAGSSWVPPLLTALEYLDHSGAYARNPREQFIEHCWVAPYPEDNLEELMRHIPADHILFGSDWPHGEGFAHPRDFFHNLGSCSDADVRRIMRENAHALTFPQ